MADADPEAAPPAVSIRPAAYEDLPAILGFIRELAEYERAPEAVVATEELLARHLFGSGFGRGPTAECLIGEVDGRPEGFAVYCMNFSTWLGRPGVWLEDLFVRPSARGCGLGATLFRAVAAVAVARDCGRMEWSVLDWNEPAIGFYRRHGAIALDEWTTHRLEGAALRAVAGA